MNQDKLEQLKIASEDRQRGSGSFWIILVGVVVIVGVALFFAIPRESDKSRLVKGGKPVDQAESKPNDKTGGTSGTTASANANPSPAKATQGKVQGSLLTVSGYIINRERIELSPRFMGVVKWIGVKKGDAVTNGQVVVLLDDTEYRARYRETEGRLATAQVSVERAEMDFRRAKDLVSTKVETQKVEDDARLALASAKAFIQEIKGQLDLAQTYLDWTVIHSPINGVVLEKLVDPNELVVPQSFGGGRGPSTALISVADPKDLQVEIDVSEADLAKVYLGQKCKISPEAYLDHVYEGSVVEIAPEANRQKGTLQIKVQILNPDRFLTPELSAKVDFLAAPKP